MVWLIQLYPKLIYIARDFALLEVRPTGSFKVLVCHEDLFLKKLSRKA